MKNIRYLLESLLLLLLLVISKILPAGWASGLGGLIGRTVGPRLAASRKAIHNIEASLPNADTNAIIKGMWDNLGRTIMEYPHLEHLGRDRTEIIGAEILEQYKDTSAILFTAHLANWEICPIAAMTQYQFKVSSVYRAPNNPFSDKILHKARSLKNTLQTIPKSKTGMRNLVKALQNKAHIGILIDQKYNEGIEANFLGRPAMTSPAFAQLAQKFDCPLIPLKIERVNGAYFRMTILPPLDIKDKSVEEIVTKAHSLLEGWIRDKPDQWLWLHRRWDSKKLKNRETHDT